MSVFIGSTKPNKKKVVIKPWKSAILDFERIDDEEADRLWQSTILDFERIDRPVRKKRPAKKRITGNRDAEIASEIVRQIGGNQFAAMTGATFVRDGAKLLVKFKGSTKFNYMTIALNGRDLYDVALMKIRAGKASNEMRFEDIYAEDLRGLFERYTGLRTSLTRVFA